MEFLQVECKDSLNWTEVVKNSQELDFSVSGFDQPKTVESLESIHIEGIHIRDFLEPLNLLL
jgi:hypothetical protein